MSRADDLLTDTDRRLVESDHPAFLQQLTRAPCVRATGRIRPPADRFRTPVWDTTDRFYPTGRK